MAQYQPSQLALTSHSDLRQYVYESSTEFSVVVPLSAGSSSAQLFAGWDTKAMRVEEESVKNDMRRCVSNARQRDVDTMQFICRTEDAGLLDEPKHPLLQIATCWTPNTNRLTVPKNPNSSVTYRVEEGLPGPSGSLMNTMPVDAMLIESLEWQQKARQILFAVQVDALGHARYVEMYNPMRGQSFMACDGSNTCRTHLLYRQFLDNDQSSVSASYWAAYAVVNAVQRLKYRARNIDKLQLKLSFMFMNIASIPGAAPHNAEELQLYRRQSVSHTGPAFSGSSMHQEQSRAPSARAWAHMSARFKQPDFLHDVTKLRLQLSREYAQFLVEHMIGKMCVVYMMGLLAGAEGQVVNALTNTGRTAARVVMLPTTLTYTSTLFPVSRILVDAVLLDKACILGDLSMKNVPSTIVRLNAGVFGRSQSPHSIKHVSLPIPVAQLRRWCRLVSIDLRGGGVMLRPFQDYAFSNECFLSGQYSRYMHRIDYASAVTDHDFSGALSISILPLRASAGYTGWMSTSAWADDVFRCVFEFMLPCEVSALALTTLTSYQMTIGSSGYWELQMSSVELEQPHVVRMTSEPDGLCMSLYAQNRASMRADVADDMPVFGSTDYLLSFSCYFNFVATLQHLSSTLYRAELAYPCYLCFSTRNTHASPLFGRRWVCTPCYMHNTVSQLTNRERLVHPQLAGVEWAWFLKQHLPCDIHVAGNAPWGSSLRTYRPRLFDPVIGTSYRFNKIQVQHLLMRFNRLREFTLGRPTTLTELLGGAHGLAGSHRESSKIRLCSSFYDTNPMSSFSDNNRLLNPFDYLPVHPNRPSTTDQPSPAIVRYFASRPLNSHNINILGISKSGTVFDCHSVEDNVLVTYHPEEVGRVSGWPRVGGVYVVNQPFTLCLPSRVIDTSAARSFSCDLIATDCIDEEGLYPLCSRCLSRTLLYGYEAARAFMTPVNHNAHMAAEDVENVDPHAMVLFESSSEDELI